MSLSSVLTMGFQPAGDIHLITSMGYGHGAEPPPPPPVDVVQRFFGGGPFIRRYGYDPRYYSQDEEDLYAEAKELREELPGEQAEIVEEAILEAATAVQEQKKEVFLDAKKIYDRVFSDVRKSLRDDLWRAEIERRIHEEEEEMMLLALIAED